MGKHKEYRVTSGVRFYLGNGIEFTGSKRTYRTSDPVIQQTIEGTTYFRQGIIVLDSQEEDAVQVAPPNAPKRKAAPDAAKNSVQNASNQVAAPNVAPPNTPKQKAAPAGVSGLLHGVRNDELVGMPDAQPDTTQDAPSDTQSDDGGTFTGGRVVKEGTAYDPGSVKTVQQAREILVRYYGYDAGKLTDPGSVLDAIESLKLVFVNMQQ